MNKTRCTNQHWFDADEYSACPHCGAQRMTEEMAAALESGTILDSRAEGEKPKKKGFFKGKNKSKEQDIKTTGGVIEIAASIKTSGIPYGSSITHSVTSNPKEEPINPEVLGAQQFPRTGVLIPPASGATPGGVQDIKTITIYANEQGEEPVTGWLVCVHGEYKGRSFPLKAGVNVIGRDEKAYICLKKDLQVSREKHASVIYEPKKKIFYLGEGENSMTYCNDELVCGKQEINAYDSIEIGGGKYLFIPLCGERFDWDKEN